MDICKGGRKLRHWKNPLILFFFLAGFLLYSPETPLFADGGVPDNSKDEAYTIERGVFLSGVGEGFRPGTNVMGLSVGVTDGLVILGSTIRHDLALMSVYYGRMIGKVKGIGHWYQGNWELRLELFGGAQFNDEILTVFGLTPHLRYNFATGTRLIPYIDAGAGVSVTEIRKPDLGGPFAFNLQAITGLNYLVSDTVGLNIGLQYFHISSAGIYRHNDGVNTLGLFLGMQRFF